MTPAPADNPTHAAPNAGAPLTAADVFPVARAAAVLTGVTLVVVGLTYAGLRIAGQPLHANLNLLAAAICGGTGLVALLPVWLGSKQSSHGAATGFMAGILVRMMLAGGIVMGLMWGTDWPHAQSLSMWVAGWYLLVLLVEVKLISSFVTQVAPGAPRYPQFNAPASPAGQPVGQAATKHSAPAPAPSN